MTPHLEFNSLQDQCVFLLHRHHQHHQAFLTLTPFCAAWMRSLIDAAPYLVYNWMWLPAEHTSVNKGCRKSSTLNQSNLCPPSLTQRENREAHRGRGTLSLCVESDSSQPNWLVLSCGKAAVDLFCFYSGGFPLHSNGRGWPISCSDCVVLMLRCQMLLCECVRASVCVCSCFQFPSEACANCNTYKHIQQHVHTLTTRKQSFYSCALRL